MIDVTERDHSMGAVEPQRAVRIDGAPAHAPVLCQVAYSIGSARYSRVTSYRGLYLGDIDVLQYEGVGVHSARAATHQVRSYQRLSDHHSAPCTRRISAIWCLALH